MKFRELLEAEEKKNQDGESHVTIDTILSDLDGIYKDQKRMVAFLNKINRPGQQPEKTFTYGGDGSNEGKGGKSVSYTIDSNSNQPSDEFRQIMSKIKDGHTNTWKEEIEKCLDKLDNAKRQGYIRTFFIPKLEDPGAKVTNRSSRYSDGRVAGVSHYKKFGQAMVFYSSKCVSKLADADTKIGADKIKLIMQGCFGASPDANREDDDYLTQFMTLEPKMKIDAAKNVINSIRVAGTNDIKGLKTDDEYMSDSYYSGLSYVMNMLFEADDKEDKKDKNTNVPCPKSIDEFSKNINTALKQAKAVAEKYPKQYKLWYEKLRSAFEEGVEDYQKKERDPELAKNGIENPITGEIEHRNGKAWGVGGPAAFIRNHEDLKNITDKIRQGTPGVEGVHGWDIFNFGPKLILTMIDALEKGGKIYQRICDDIGAGMKQMKKSLINMKPADFDKLIKKYAEEDQHQEAMAVSLAGVITGIANLYRILANGKIGQINEKTATFNSENNGSETVIQTRIDDLKNSLAKLMKEKPDYDKWLEVQNKKKEEQKKKLEAEIKQAEEGKATAENSSYKPVFSVKNLITEEEEAKTETSRQKEIEAKKKQLEKLDSEHKKKVNVNVKNYIAILDDYKQVMSLQPEIKNLYEYIRLLFNADYAEEEYSKHFNNKGQQESGESTEQQEEKQESLSIKINNHKLFEDNGETAAEGEEFDDSDGQESSSSSKSEDKKEKKAEDGEPQYSSNEGNTNWIKNGSGKSLRELYRLFAEDNSAIQVNISKFKELAEAKNPKEETTHIVNIFKKLFESLQNLDIQPIKDGIVALSKVDMKEMAQKQDAIEIIKFVKEGGDKEEKQDKKKSSVNIERRDKLISFIDENSNIMKNIVGKLNNCYYAKDDSWLNEYKQLKTEFQQYGNEIYKYLNKIYPDGKAHDYIETEVKKIGTYTFLTKVWATISLTKAIAQKLDSLENKENKEKKESIIVKSNNLINEDNIPALLKNVESLVTNAKKQMKDFNAEMLPTDYKAKVYDIINPKIFNDLETQLAKGFGIGETNTGANLVGFVRSMVPDMEDNSDNPLIKVLKDNNCSELFQIINYGAKSKDTKDGDRDTYLLLGATYGIIYTLNAKAKGTARTDDHATHPKTVQKTDDTGANAKPLETQEKQEEKTTDKQSVIIPEISPDMLMNEIYKYIKGN